MQRRRITRGNQWAFVGQQVDRQEDLKKTRNGGTATEQSIRGPKRREEPYLDIQVHKRRAK